MGSHYVCRCILARVTLKSRNRRYQCSRNLTLRKNETTGPSTRGKLLHPALRSMPCCAQASVLDQCSRLASRFSHRRTATVGQKFKLHNTTVWLECVLCHLVAQHWLTGSRTAVQRFAAIMCRGEQQSSRQKLLTQDGHCQTALGQQLAFLACKSNGLQHLFLDTARSKLQSFTAGKPLNNYEASTGLLCMQLGF